MVRRERQGNNGSAMPPGQRWHLPAEPSTLAKLESISATTLSRLVLRTQQRCKEVSPATQSGTSQGEAPPHLIHTARVPTWCDVEYAAHVH